MDTAQLLQTSKLIAVPIPFVLAGYSLGFSQNSVPTFYDVPAEVSTPAFKRVFTDGATVIVPSALISVASASYLAYMIPAQRNIWAAAAIACAIPGPWTTLIMGRGINRLIEISGDKGKQEKATANLEARQLLIRWVKQNYVRSACFLFAGVAALRATIAA